MVTVKESRHGRSTARTCMVWLCLNFVAKTNANPHNFARTIRYLESGSQTDFVSKLLWTKIWESWRLCAYILKSRIDIDNLCRRFRWECQALFLAKTSYIFLSIHLRVCGPSNGTLFLMIEFVWTKGPRQEERRAHSVHWWDQQLEYVQCPVSTSISAVKIPCLQVCIANPQTTRIEFLWSCSNECVTYLLQNILHWKYAGSRNTHQMRRFLFIIGTNNGFRRIRINARWTGWWGLISH